VNPQKEQSIIFRSFIMAQAMLQSASHHNVHYLHSPHIEREKIQAFAIAQNALVTALHHVRANDGNLLRAMANTRRALDAIQDMRQLIK
jgi:hypothetical protein